MVKIENGVIYLCGMFRVSSVLLDPMKILSYVIIFSGRSRGNMVQFYRSAHPNKVCEAEQNMTAILESNR